MWLIHLRAIDNPTSIVFTRHSGNTTFNAINFCYQSLVCCMNINFIMIDQYYAVIISEATYTIMLYLKM